MEYLLVVLTFAGPANTECAPGEFMFGNRGQTYATASACDEGGRALVSSLQRHSEPSREIDAYTCVPHPAGTKDSASFKPFIDGCDVLQ